MVCCMSRLLRQTELIEFLYCCWSNSRCYRTDPDQAPTPRQIAAGLTGIQKQCFCAGVRINCKYLAANAADKPKPEKNAVLSDRKIAVGLKTSLQDGLGAIVRVEFNQFTTLGDRIYKIDVQGHVLASAKILLCFSAMWLPMLAIAIRKTTVVVAIGGDTLTFPLSEVDTVT